MDFSSFATRGWLGRAVRLPLRLIPKDAVLPVLQGPLRGRRWIAGPPACVVKGSMHMLKLDLGCGPFAKEGWESFDNSPSAFLARHPILKWLLWKLGLMTDDHYRLQWSRNIRWKDVTRGLPYRDNTVDLIHVSHLLEHLSQQQGEKLLLECRRVLKPGGVIRIAVPDLFRAAKEYVQNVAPMMEGLAPPDRAPHDRFLEMMFSGCLRRMRSGHRYAYDYPTLAVLLCRLGFRDVERCSYRKSRHSDLSEMDSRPEDSIYLEAVK